jgi:ubiquinone/menaquinone biosynthesis C-methylase UbiE
MNLKLAIRNRIFTIPGVGSANESFRVNWLQNALKSIPNGFRILDAGAGEQQFKKYCTHLNYVSQDFAQYKPDDLKSGLQMAEWDYGTLDIISDIASIPEPDNSFDAIMCTEVFEHIINPREAITEFKRLLKPGGILIITAPFCSLTHFAPYHFYTGFNRYFYETALKDNGFDIEEITENGNFFEFLAQELNRVPSMGKFYSNSKTTFIEKIAARIVLKMLQRFSDKNKNSEELLCFGLHVVAKKSI